MFVNQMTRRRMLAQGSAAAVLLGAGGALARAAGANERISIGCIGTGDRCSALIGEIIGLAKQHNVEITAVCDVWKHNLEKAAATVEKAFGKAPRRFTRFNDLLALNDIHAVVVATPDFGHSPIMIAALKAGKDVYCEKPMSQTIEEANEALDLARKGERVVQVGTQRRSMGLFKAASKEYASGVLGTVSRVSAAMSDRGPRWARDFSNCQEQDVDWDAYLFNRPKVAFDPKLLRRWHLYKMCTNGLSGLWMSHYSDSVHLVTGATYPASAAALGGTYAWHDGREHDDTFHAVIEYPGFLMDWGMGLGNSADVYFVIRGINGSMDLETWTISGSGAADPKKLETRKIKPEANESHMGNWLECLRTRKRPNADIQYGHQHSVATIMAAAARETGRRHVYDPEKRIMKPV